jgi:uncharacterized membrane protein (DUF485 family)
MAVTHEGAVDWRQIEQLPEFRELVARRRRFVVPATVFFLCWYFGFVVLAGYAETFMGSSIYEGFTVGYLLALTQFLMVAVLGVWYLRYSARHLDPLRDRVAERARELLPDVVEERPPSEPWPRRSSRFSGRPSADLPEPEPGS